MLTGLEKLNALLITLTRQLNKVNNPSDKTIYKNQIDVIEAIKEIYDGTGEPIQADILDSDIVAETLRTNDAEAKLLLTETSLTAEGTDANIPITITPKASNIQSIDGTTSLPTYSFTSDPNTGMFKSGADSLGFVTGGTEHWLINASGALNPLTNNSKDIGNGTVNVRDVNISRGIKVYTASEVGTRGITNSTCTMETFGDGKNFTTVITLTDFIIGALAGAAADLTLGNPIFNFPAGYHWHNITYRSLALKCAGTPVAVDLGVGSVKCAGAVQSVLSGESTTCEDYLTGLATTTSASYGTAIPQMAINTAGTLTAGISLNLAGDVKAVYLNAAATWNADNTGNLLASGTITLKWSKLS